MSDDATPAEELPAAAELPSTDEPPSAEEQRSTSERLRSLAGRAGRSKLVFVAWVVLGTLVFVPILFGASAQLGPGTVRASIQPSLTGRTELGLPPLGAVRARTHRAPVELGLELREVDVLEAISREGRPDAVTVDDPVPVIAAEVRDDLGAAVARVLVTLAGVSVLVGAVGALAFPGRRSLGRIGAGALIGPLTMTLLVAPAALSFDAEAFEREPELVGQLGSATELVARVGSLETRFGSVESRTRVLSEKIAGLYSSSLTGEISRSDGEVVLLHVSDLHLNTIGLALARDLAADFDVNAVIDTGDITSFGFAPEAAFFDLFADFEVPYYVVAGNHDSESIREQLAAEDDVILLDGTTVDIDGVKVLGVGDPTVTALRKIPKERLDRTYRAQYPSTEELVEAEEPDLLMVHNPVQARPALGSVPVIAAGHLHRTQLDVIDGSVLAVVGSSGATGLGDLLLEEEASFAFELLRFVDGELVAVDQIELRGADGDFVLNRVLIRDEPDDTADDVTDEEVDEPSLEELEEQDPDLLTTSTIDPDLLDADPLDRANTNTTSTTTTAAPGG